tara:strand:+ start:61 stop:399 length:339 start_codon:yes stop_codon:yes gene_type:complete
MYYLWKNLWKTLLQLQLILNKQAEKIPSTDVLGKRSAGSDFGLVGAVAHHGAEVAGCHLLNIVRRPVVVGAVLKVGTAHRTEFDSIQHILTELGSEGLRVDHGSCPLLTPSA